MALVLLIAMTASLGFAADRVSSSRSNSRFLDNYFFLLKLLEERQGSSEMLNGLGFYASGEMGLQIINQTRSERELGNGSDGQASFDLDDYRSGFLVSRRIKFDLAAGPGHIIEDAPGLISGPYLALMPEIGSTVTFQQRVKRQEDIAGNPLALNPKIELKNTANWKNGDHLSFDASGGIMFSGGFGTAILANAEVRYLATGSWMVEVEKFGDDAVYLKITRRKLHSLFERISLAGFQLSRNDFGQSDNLFSFAFDLSDPTARRAYEEACDGRLYEAERLAAEGSDAVKQIAVGESAGYGSSARFSVGMVFLGRWIWKNNHETYTTASRFASGSERTLYYGIYQWEKEQRGILVDFYKKNTGFVARYLQGKASGAATPDTFSGQFEWSFERAVAKKKHLVSALGEIGKRLGIEDQLALSIPKVNFGMIRATLHLELSKSATERLMESFSDAESREMLFVRGSTLVDQYLVKGDDPSNLCSLGGEEDLEQCRERLKRETRYAFKKMKKLVGKMLAARREDPRDFVKAYSEFGRYFLKNRFTFKAVLSEVSDRVGPMTLSFQGERISQAEKKIEIVNGVLRSLP